MTIKDSLGHRMKTYYEQRNQTALQRRTPVIIRVDGKAFHTLLRGADKPYDYEIQGVMVDTMIALMSEIQGAIIGYTQSDEISIVLKDYERLETQAWFDYNVQKLCSVSASIATASFNALTHNRFTKLAYFDARAFNLPGAEVLNYLHWRQADWTRNSVMMLARSHYSQTQVHGKNRQQLKEMLLIDGVDWDKQLDSSKYGTFAFKVNDSLDIMSTPLKSMYDHFTSLVTFRV